MKNLRLVLKSVVLVGIASYVPVGFAAQDVVGAAEVSVKKIDAASKVVVVDAGNDVVHTYRLSDDMVVHTARGTEEGLRGISVGSRVAIHYSTEGGRTSIHEIDMLGDDGLKTAKGTVVHVDRLAKVVSIKATDGSVQSFDLADRTAADSARGADKAGKVTLYYTEQAGKKTVHFIGRVI